MTSSLMNRRTLWRKISCSSLNNVRWIGSRFPLVTRFPQISGISHSEQRELSRTGSLCLPFAVRLAARSAHYELVLLTIITD